MARIKYYAGVGSRRIPPDIRTYMTNTAEKLAWMGYWLRSGQAEGADQAFECGAGHMAEIYRPWGKSGYTDRGAQLIVPSGKNLDLAITLMSVIHPRWDLCTSGARLLHARNVNQVWGADLNTPVDFLVCWADWEDSNSSAHPQDRRIHGGTSTAWELARAADIPRFNLVDGTQSFDEFLQSLESDYHCAKFS